MSANPYLPPRQPSLRTAAGEAKVKESLSSLFVLPRAAAAAPARGRPCIRRARHSWLTGACATGMVKCRVSRSETTEQEA